MLSRAPRKDLVDRITLWFTIALVAGGCQVVPEGTASRARARALDGADAQQVVTSSNADGVWTATASASAGEGVVRGVVTFTGPAGKARRMGMCLVQRYGSDQEGVACMTDKHCSSAPAVLPSGEFRYCVAPDASSAKYCHYRPGPPARYCVGAPALGGARIAPGSYRIEVPAPRGSQWLALACFEGCEVAPPSISGPAMVR